MVTATGKRNPLGIVVRWVEPTCSDVNDAEVTGYVIRYGPLSGARQKTTPTITSGKSFTINDNDLQLYMEYSIEVAASNRKGVGQFSQHQTAVITGGENNIITVK